MLESRVVTGKVIDIRDGKVFTLHGDMVSTYHLGYYEMMNEEFLPVTDSQQAAAPTAGLMAEETAESSGWLRREWKPLTSFITAWRKSANRA
ncbi:hypothetical protein OHJ21_23620 [Virgibacillus sp. LDC1]|uniref:hypothetical protein n=1 Tax=Paenibacillus TaxID=44249 RepID=UPI000C26ED13|nr:MULTISPECIES: hypothetical protein [Paenibacillus]MCV4234159.1 hypothetical protein [Virgibacillus sp. LDC1]MEC0253580.1 hypothetical protein [Paenibacillus lautus]MEC0308564.1 hypothetical protein [Paenibacillus lautus]PJN51775.1 hypothetical protein PAEVO_48680 [Paenibacillus sp. GM2FR]